MADAADRAKAHEEAVLAARIKAFQGRPRGPASSASHCRDCGEEIPEGRRRAVTTELCATCAEDFEREASCGLTTGRSGSM